MLLGVPITGIAIAVARAQVGLPLKRILMVSDLRWVNDRDISEIKRFAGGSARLDALGFTFETRHVDIGDTVGLSALTDFVARDPPEMLIVVGDDEAVALHAKVPLIPLIFVCAIDPRCWGLVDDLDTPGGTATGISTDLANFTKPLEFLLDIVGAARHKVAIVAGREWFAPVRMNIWRSAAALRGVELVQVAGSSFEELSNSEGWRRLDVVDSVIVPVSQAVVTNTQSVINHLNQVGVPAIFERFVALQMGGAMAFEDQPIGWTRAVGAALGLICSGVAPGTIPIRVPAEWQFAVNTSALERLGLKLTPVVEAAVSRVF